MSSSFRFFILASSSAGNSAYITDGHTHLLVDCGLSRRESFARLESIGVDPSCLDAILITHEHCDHVSGLGPIAKKLKKTRQYLTYPRRRKHHGLGDPREHGDERRDRDARVHQRLETAEALAAAQLDCADFGNRVMVRRPARCLKIDDCDRR